MNYKKEIKKSNSMDNNLPLTSSLNLRFFFIDNKIKYLHRKSLP